LKNKPEGQDRFMERPFEHEKKLEQDSGSGISPFNGALSLAQGSGPVGTGSDTGGNGSGKVLKEYKF